MSIVSRHSFWGVDEFITPKFTEADLKALDEYESAVKPYETTNAKGEKVTKEFDRYAATQEARRMERVMRKTRQKAAGFKAGGLMEDYKSERAKYHAQIHEYERFCEAMDL